MITTSRIYTAAQGIIATLKTNVDLAPLVIDEVFDDASQVQRLELTTKAMTGAITVTPGTMTSIKTDPGTKMVRFNSLMLISIFVQENATIEGHATTGSYISAIKDLIITTLKPAPSINPINQMVIMGDTEIDLAIDGALNLTGDGVLVQVPINF